MRRAAFGFALLALSACSSGAEPEAAEPVATASASPDDAFVTALEADVPNYELRSDRQDWLDLGYEACETLDNGRDDAWTASALVSVRGVEEAQASTVVAAAREHLCPEVG